MSRGQDQLQEAADACAAAADGGSDDSGERLKDVGADILELKDSTFAKSALCVPLTAAVSRAAIAVLDATGSDGVDDKIAALEAAVKNFGDKAGGIGGMAIT
jgi:hypothetical protein